jgi:hypothetical protein
LDIAKTFPKELSFCYLFLFRWSVCKELFPAEAMLRIFVGYRYRIHVIDADPTSMSAGGWLEDTSLVEKYTISEDAYNKREGGFCLVNSQASADFCIEQTH